MRRLFKPFRRALIVIAMVNPGTIVQSQEKISFTVAMEKPAAQQFQVTMHCYNNKAATITLKMPVWTPGYYQKMNYADQLGEFSASDEAGKSQPWQKVNNNTWEVQVRKAGPLIIKYTIKATRAFVANSFLDTSRAYIIPASVFLYPDGRLDQSSVITIKPNKWKQVATGLEPAARPFTFTAPNYDVLYDSPLLIGNLDSLPTFSVGGVPHRFIGYQLGNFDRQQLVKDLQSVVTAAVAVIGDIPFRHYTFIGIGPGQGGIEHLNSTTISFSNSGVQTREARIRTLNFIGHEYFHHYNVKRIRPFELGPFDYDKGNRTNLLWISEGLSVYYEYLIVRRAGISNEEELFNAFRSNIRAYEGKPGRLFQSLTQASYETWSDGPFGRTGDEINKTISYYDKGPVVGLMLDFAIRHASNNKKSLDDVMRTLYQRYYQQMKRGFTDAEFRMVSEEMAGQPLSELFEYTNTVKELNYKKYFNYGGLDIDTTLRDLPGAWLGVGARMRNDSVFVSNVDYESPAWNAGLRNRQVILEIDGQKATGAIVQQLSEIRQAGDTVQLKVLQGSSINLLSIKTTIKKEASFKIKRLDNPDQLQVLILKDWLQ